MFCFRLQNAVKRYTLQQNDEKPSWQKNHITIDLDNAEHQTLIALSQRFDLSFAWFGRRALPDLIEKYNQTESPLSIPSLEKSLRT